MQESSPNMREPEESMRSHDVDTYFTAWMGSFEAAAEQDSRIQKDV